jgi:hypothetical protein
VPGPSCSRHVTGIRCLGGNGGFLVAFPNDLRFELADQLAHLLSIEHSPDCSRWDKVCGFPVELVALAVSGPHIRALDCGTVPRLQGTRGIRNEAGEQAAGVIAVAKPETRHTTNISGARTNCRLPVGALPIGALDASIARILWPGFSPTFSSVA